MAGDETHRAEPHQRVQPFHSIQTLVQSTPSRPKCSRRLTEPGEQWHEVHRVDGAGRRVESEEMESEEGAEDHHEKKAGQLARPPLVERLHVRKFLFAHFQDIRYGTQCRGDDVVQYDRARSIRRRRRVRYNHAVTRPSSGPASRAVLTAHSRPCLSSRASERDVQPSSELR